MPRRPAYLKGLATTRARAAGDAERLRALIAELEEHLAERQAEIAACDRLIRKFDERLEPAKIQPTRGHNRYGRRGELTQAILEHLRKAAGEVTTIELAVALQARFGLDFVSWEERRRWVKNSVTPALKEMVAAGVVERLHEPRSKSGETGRWRLTAGCATSFADITARVQGAGGAVILAGAED